MSENQTRCNCEDRVCVAGGDDYLYESGLWSHDRIHTALDEERTREDGNVKKSFLTIPKWNTEDVRSAGAAGGQTEWKQQSCIRVVRRETRGIEISSRTRWVPIQASSIGNRDKASSHDGREAQCGLMMVTQRKRCHENDDSASVRRVRCSVRCRVVHEASLKQVVA